MSGFKDKMGKLKDWMISEEDTAEEEYDGYDDADEYDDDEYGYDSREDNISSETSYSSESKSRFMQDYSSHNQVNVVVAVPKTYNDDANLIADHLKNRNIVIVNLESVASASIKKSIFDFMAGVVYVLEGNMLEVDAKKSIYILTPRNVNISNKLAEEIVSSPILPWSKK